LSRETKFTPDTRGGPVVRTAMPAKVKIPKKVTTWAAQVPKGWKVEITDLTVWVYPQEGWSIVVDSGGMDIQSQDPQSLQTFTLEQGLWLLSTIRLFYGLDPSPMGKDYDLRLRQAELALGGRQQ
jgi:hypothetical protein